MSGSDPPSQRSSSDDDDYVFDPLPVADHPPRSPSPLANHPINPVFEKRVLRKVDRRLLPILAVLNALAYLDASNLPSARLLGAADELGLDIGRRYNIINLIFFVPFISLQLPSNLAISRVGAPTWLGINAILLGALTISMGFVGDWREFVGCRLLIGFLEAIILPSCVYLISTWYTRRELHFRFAVFYSATVFVSAFGNIVNYSFSKVHSGSMQGWRWILVLEGVITVIASLYGTITSLDFPDKRVHANERFFGRDERRLVQQRIREDRQDEQFDGFSGEKFLAYARDANVWLFGLMMFCAMMPVYAYFSVSMTIYYSLFIGRSDASQVCFGLDAVSNFLVSYSWSMQTPFLHRRENLSLVDTQALYIPVGLFACVVVLAAPVYARLRGSALTPVVVFLFLMTLLGLCLIAYPNARAARYLGCFLAYAGAQANVPTILAHQAINTRTYSKRAITGAIVLSLGSAGGLLGSALFPPQDTSYTTGLSIAIGLQLLGALATISLSSRMRKANEAAKKTQSNVPYFIEGLEGFEYCEIASVVI
ncbi:MFS general substrate transporter [Schizopora paradoxa]|uniref:MFS general substrate transporter n=1 Tax=Schizopora paradoxa TaxID=27342 RepID=A0A0H2RFA1_9AGAM|nr:MFS general substrate transporter [Schizopora paradoxa]